MKSIFWFKRDLRVDDNRALNECFSKSDKVYPIFIFDEKILEELNCYDNRLYFIKNMVERLRNEIDLNIFFGKTSEVFQNIIEKVKPDRVYTAESLSWSGEIRNKIIRDICERNNIEFVEIFDNFLVDIRKIEYTKVFSNFFKKWVKNLDCKIIDKKQNYQKKSFLFDLNDFEIPKYLEKLQPSKGFYWTWDFLQSRLEIDFRNYENKRNSLHIDGTSKLSPYIRFGVVSIRKIYNITKNQSDVFLKELSWREFWYHIKHYFPSFKYQEFQEKRRGILWENKSDLIEKFFEGKTGYPIIDAAIKQLKSENWMHNRARMIVGSFLTKDLLTDWRIGEKFFSKYLIDYDEVVNTGNWQWIASVGPDPKPLRIFNPILQSKKFDPECKYIKKFLPELSNIDNEKIHDPLKNKIDYFEPIVDHKDRLKKINKVYKNRAKI